MNAPAKLNTTVGQEVVFLPYTSYEHRPQFGWKVTRVSPSGKMEVTAPHNPAVVLYFNAQGYEVQGNMNGKLKSYGSTVNTDVDGWKARTAFRQRAETAAQAVNAVKVTEAVRGSWGKEHMLRELEKLEAALAIARAAVNDI